MSYIEMSSNLRFLIIDSVQSTAIQLKQDLVKVGYRNSAIVEEEVKAIELLKGDNFDFVFCRQNMPRVSGTEMLDELKNDFNVTRRPFVIYLEDTDKDDVMLAAESGADKIMIVPYNIKDLAERIANTWAKYIDPNNPEIPYEKARKHFLQGQFKEAEAIFKDLIDKKMMLGPAMVGQVRSRLAQGQKTEALVVAKKLAEEFPKLSLAHHWLGESLVATGNVIEAVQAFMKAISLCPKNPVRYQKVSEILASLQQWEPTMQVLKQAEEKKLQYNFVEEGLAKALIKLGKKDAAIEYYQILVKRNPKVANYCNNIAVCFMALHNHNKAVQYLNRGLEVDPKNTSILFNLALIWAEKDKKDKAIEKLKEILSIDPKFEKAKAKLAQLTGGTKAA